MSHHKFLVIVPPAQSRRAAAPGGIAALLYLLWQCLAVHGFLLLISLAVFLAASPSVRFLIAAGWISYLVAATAFVVNLIANARSATR